MKSIRDIMTDTTSTSKENSIFNKLGRIVYVTDVCECGSEYDAAYTINIPSKGRRGFESKKCFVCESKEQISIILEQGEDEIAKEWKEKYKKQFYDGSLINPKLKEADFNSYEPVNNELEKAKKIAKRYADNFDHKNPVSLLFIGNYGTGKSHLSVAICKELLEKSESALFISTPKLLTKLRSTYHKDSVETEDQIIKRLTHVKLLDLDDIGAEHTKINQDENNQTWATSKLFEIIDNRIGKHTIFTTNFEPADLQQRLGGRNFSRMMEGVHVVKMYGDDYRLRNFK